ncbi:MAG: glycosyltransferase [Planctomycetota bacterium]|nr:glycosyltransferase [Planctomycetota bacterium]
MAAKARNGRVRRVLLVTPRLLDSSGGRAATDLALRLDRRRFEPAVCCYDGWGPLARELLEAGIEIFPLRRRTGLDLTFPVALAREIRRRRIDLVHTLNARRAYVVGTLGALLAGANPGVATFRDTPPLGQSRLLAHVGRLCGEIVGVVVATSEEVREVLFRERWVPPGKTIIVRDGVNVERFRHAGQGEEARTHWGIPPDVPLIGAVLQAHRPEERELLLETFRAVRAGLPAARLLVAGNVEDGEGVRGIGVFGDSPALYAAIDVLCVPLASRVVPLTLLEGLAAGVPVAASLSPDDEGLPPEGPWAFANVTRPGAEALAKGIIDLLGAPDDARALARAGRSCIEEEHPIDANVERMQALYEAR